MSSILVSGIVFNLDFLNIIIFVILMTKNILILEGGHMSIKKIEYFL